MDDLKYKIKKHLYIVIIILIGYIGIKLIDNYSIFFNIYEKAMKILTPFIIGAIIAYLLNPLVKLLEKKCKLSRGLSILVTFIIVILIFTLSIVYIVPGVTSNIKGLINTIPDMMNVAQDWIRTHFNSALALKLTQKFDIVQAFGHWSSTLFNTVLNSILSVTASILNLVFASIIAAYYLFYKEIFIKGTRKWLFMIFKEKWAKRILEFSHSVNYMLGTYLWVRTIESTIIAIACAIGLIFIKSEYIILISVFFGITNMIPYFGPLLGILFGALLNLFFDPIKAVIVLIWLFILQQIDGNWLGPKMSASSVGVNPVTCLLALAIGGSLYGIVGMVICIPIAGAIKIYYERFCAKYNLAHPETVDLINNYKVDISHLKTDNKSSNNKIMNKFKNRK